MVAKVVENPELFFTDPTSIYDYDDEKIRHLAETKPWLDGEGPPPVMYRVKVDSLKGCGQLDVSDPEVQTYEWLTRAVNAKKEGKSLVGLQMANKLRLSCQPGTLPKGSADMFYFLENCCTEPMKRVLEEFAPDLLEFWPLPVVYDDGTEISDGFVYRLNLMSLAPDANYRASACSVFWRVDKPCGFKSGSFFEFFEYHLEYDKRMFRLASHEQSGDWFASQELVDMCDEAGLKLNRSQPMGWAFPDGTGYHPIVLPEWPPEPLPHLSVMDVDDLDASSIAFEAASSQKADYRTVFEKYPKYMPMFLRGVSITYGGDE